MRRYISCERCTRCPHNPPCDSPHHPLIPPRHIQYHQEHPFDPGEVSFWVAAAIVVIAFFLGAIVGKARAEGVLESSLCAARAAYWEARSEGVEGMRAVAHVVFNRAAEKGVTPCAVVNSVGWNGPGWVEQIKKPTTDIASWKLAQSVALLALQDPDGDPTQGATHFHRLDVSPGWSGGVRVVVIGAHLFLALKP